MNFKSNNPYLFSRDCILAVEHNSKLARFFIKLISSKGLNNLQMYEYNFAHIFT